MADPYFSSGPRRPSTLAKGLVQGGPSACISGEHEQVGCTAAAHLVHHGRIPGTVDYVELHGAITAARALYGSGPTRSSRS
jgi:hypothetical protein